VIRQCSICVLLQKCFILQNNFLQIPEDLILNQKVTVNCEIDTQHFHLHYTNFGTTVHTLQLLAGYVDIEKQQLHVATYTKNVLISVQIMYRFITCVQILWLL